MARRHTYTAYSIGCAIAWALIWLVLGTQADDQTRSRWRLGFLGWVSGWTSATIARSVYPPPRRTALTSRERDGARDSG